jgi:LmbE family N-acetylglucosaminyl deacetylase
VSESSNADRFATRPLSAGGTPADVWTGWERRFPELDLSACPLLILVAPHPDDETLGLGATAAMLASRGIPVQVVSVTDGGASHPWLTKTQRRKLERIRRNELHSATELLGLAPPISLGLADGELLACTAELTQALTDRLAAADPGAWCAATWRGDGHPDHEAVGAAAAVAAERTGAVLLEYPVWMWHWASPDDDAVPWERAARITLDQTAADRKRRAASVFGTQLLPRSGGDSVLPPYVLGRLLAVGELVFK